MRLFFNEGVVPPEKVTMTLVVETTSLRSLQEQTTPSAECTIEASEKGKSGTVKYNCEAESDNKPDVIKTKNDLVFYKKETDTAPSQAFGQGEISIAPQAYEDATNLDAAPKTTQFATLYGEVTGKTTYFVISGKLDGDTDALNELMNAKTIDFKFYGNSLNSNSQGQKRRMDEIIPMNCPVTNPDKDNYEITCRPSEGFQGNLHTASGNVSSTSLTLNLDAGKDAVNVDPNESSQKNPTYYRKNSSGLSGGAIAGIIIACAAALIIATILALALKGPKAPVQNNSSIVGLKTDDFQG